MRTATKLVLAGLSAALLLSLAIGTASARRISVSETHWSAIWSRLEPFTISEPEEVLGPVSCPLTLEGTLHSRTISKVSGQLIGFVTRATIGTPECVGGRVVVLASTLPWHTRYDSFVGTLPRITDIRVQFINLGLQVEGPERPTCLYLTSATQPAMANFLIPSGGTTTGRLRFQSRFQITKFSGSILCPIARFNENGQGVVRAGSETSTVLITVALVA